MRNLKNWATAAAMLALTGAAQADLFDRGGGMVYDSTQNITWLADWNYAKTQFTATGGAQGDADGLMDWTTASNWANDLVHGGYSDWRLPTALNAEGSGPCYGFDCAGSEMGHMFYVDWGATAGSNVSTGTNTTNLALFENVQPNLYWSGTEYPSNAFAWLFYLGDPEGGAGFQGVGFKVDPRYAVAVRPGDVTAVPEPQTFAMLLLGLGAVLMATRRRPR